MLKSYSHLFLFEAGAFVLIIELKPSDNSPDSRGRYHITNSLPRASDLALGIAVES